MVNGDFAKLTRKHGIKISAGFACTVEEIGLAVGEKVGHKSLARMNGGDLSGSGGEGELRRRDGHHDGPEAPPAYVSSELRLSDVAPGGSGRRSSDTLGRT
ncbi:hypothetical protein NHX12_034277 [Muraenolepis orangiensis]|uniref:Uncharacterized protein n=1 Tax=Muraenolepis orangiensis TaxID=630683 RepID=A0A9Q0D5M8_9TELE|nr:hypothetical protein NHX12_034277 [Muraenolepis orangiensis]